jgi:hypothetical protein
MGIPKSYEKFLVLCRVLRMSWDIAPLLSASVRFNDDDAMQAC